MGRFIHFTLLACLAVFSAWAAPASARPAGTSASAASSAPATPPAHDEEAADAAAKPPSEWRLGPETIDLGHELTLALPAQDGFLPPRPAAKLLESLGNLHNENLLGMVASKEAKANWFVTIRYVEEGHVKDDEKIDAAELLSSIREGTEEANKERVEKGFKAMHVEGWIDPPVYDQSQHHLVWALSASSDEFKSVNFNTRILGRSGYVSINLVTTPELLAGFKPEGAAVLHATHFNPGARYEDFNAKTDKVAEYGLAGLVLGGAGLGAMKLVKIGLLAKFWKVIVGVLIAGKKAVIAAIIAIVAVIKRLFGRKKANDSVAGG